MPDTGNQVQFSSMDDFRFPDIETPCVKVCVVDPETQFCIGCGRTRDEISGWIGMTPVTRHQIIGALPERMETLTLRKRRKGGRQGRLASIA